MSDKRLLVTGASGFVGSLLCDELVARGYPVRAVLRDSSDLNIGGCEIVRLADISSDSDWTDALRGVTTVIHLAARVHVMHESRRGRRSYGGLGGVNDPLEEFRRLNVAGTEHLARSAAMSGVKRLVYVSSVKVNGESTLSPGSSAVSGGGGRDVFTESDIPNPQDPYGISKWEAEQALHYVAEETGLEVVIVRPPLVYGCGVKGNFAQMLGVLAKGIPLPLASARNLRSLVYAGNLVDALIVCAMHPDAAGQTYLVNDGEDVSTPDLLRRLGLLIGHPARLFPCPQSLLKAAGRLIGKSGQIERLLASFRVDSSKIRRELDWMPPYTLQQGLQATAEWYRSTHP